MSLPPHPVYRTAGPVLGVGSLVGDVVITFRRGGVVPALNPIAENLFQATADFHAVYRQMEASRRERGIPVAVLAKPRTVVVLAIGAVEDDVAHRDDVWVVPFYSDRESGTPRSGRNLFRLPAWEPAGMDRGGVLDFFQATSLPRVALRGRARPCDLQSVVVQALLAKFRACLS